MENEVPKYRKKKNNSSKSEKKSNHKHEYKDCLVLGRKNWGNQHYIPTLREYCVLCGKLGRKWELPNIKTGNTYQYLDADEAIKKYSYLQIFYANYLDDYVNLDEVRDELD